MEILTRLRSPIAPPEYPDEDETRIAATANRIGLALAAIVLLAALERPIVTGLDLPAGAPAGPHEAIPAAIWLVQTSILGAAAALVSIAVSHSEQSLSRVTELGRERCAVWMHSEDGPALAEHLSHARCERQSGPARVDRGARFGRLRSDTRSLGDP